MLKSFGRIFDSKIKSAVFARLAVLYALNFIDYICTVFLLSTERFFEANPVMQFLFSAPLAAFAVKCLLPIPLMLYISAQAKTADKRQTKISLVLIDIAIFLYLAIILSHIVNFLLLFFAV